MSPRGNPYPHRYKYGKLKNPIGLDKFTILMNRVPLVNREGYPVEMVQAAHAMFYWTGFRCAEVLGRPQIQYLLDCPNCLPKGRKGQVVKIGKLHRGLVKEDLKFEDHFLLVYSVGENVLKHGKREAPVWLHESLPFVPLIIEQWHRTQAHQKVFPLPLNDFLENLFNTASNPIETKESQLLGVEVGVVKEIFVWSDFDSPTELRDEWLLPFESAMKTIRINMSGPINNEWTLKFTDLERPVGTEGNFEQYIYRLQTHCEGRLWELYTYSSPPLHRTIGPLVKFVPKLGYALFPPNFVKDLLQSYGPNKELTAFKADRDYFSIEIGNPSEYIRENFAEMSYKSSNVQEDFVTLVEKKPVGPLLLTSTDFKITYHSSKVRACRIRIEINGRLGQVGKGDTEIFQEVRERALKFLTTQIEKTLLSTQTDRVEVIKDAKSQTEIASREITQPSQPIIIKLSKPIDLSMRKRIVGLFTQDMRKSGFFGNIDWKSDSESTIRTTDTQGGGDAILNIQLGKDFLLISPISTTTARAVDRIYHVILEKVDVDSLLTHMVE